jgi:hypothetical protein
MPFLPCFSVPLNNIALGLRRGGFYPNVFLGIAGENFPTTESKGK